MRKLDEGKGVSFHEWDNREALPNLLNSRIVQNNISHKLYLKELLEKGVECFGKDSDSLERTEAENAALIIYNELSGEFPLRSIIENALKTLLAVSRDYPQFKEFKMKFNSVYNRGLAEQHHCVLNDQIDDISAIDEKLERNPDKIEDVEKLDANIVKAIGGCSWSEFFDHFHNERFAKARSAWLKEYQDAIEKPSKKEGSEAIGTIHDFGNEIVRTFEGVRDLVYKNCVFYNQNTDYILVANSSNVDLPAFGSRLCFYVPTLIDDGTFVRISTTGQRGELMSSIDSTLMGPTKLLINNLYKK
jgi:hypothetical protein